MHLYGIYTDASDYQIGAVIIQSGRATVFFSCKLTPAQLKYSTIDKEMICITEIFKEFCIILWGAEIIIWTDNLKLN